MTPTAARLVSVNRGRPRLVVAGGKRYSTAINKQPVDGPVAITSEGLDGDRVADSKNHGGVDQAVCCYPIEHYDEIGGRLGVELHIPAFGENLTTEGLLETDVCIGDTYQIGDALIQVSLPRVPCVKLAGKHNQPALIQWIEETAYTGFYCRVVQPGRVECGSRIELQHRPHPGVTVEMVARARFRASTPTAVLERLSQLVELKQEWRERFARRATRSDKEMT